MTIAIKVMKPRNAAGPSEVCTEMILASGEVGVSVMLELSKRVLDGKGMQDEWQTSVLIPIFKGRCKKLQYLPSKAVRARHEDR